MTQTTKTDSSRNRKTVHRPITSEEIELVIKAKQNKNLPTEEGPHSDDFTDNFYQTFKKVRPVLINL